jgi:integrase
MTRWICLAPRPPLALLDALCALPRPPATPITALSWTNFPLALRYTGARLHEVTVLQSDDIGEHLGTMTVHIGKGRYRRWIPVHTRWRAPLTALRSARASSLFPDIGQDELTHRFQYANNFRKHWCRDAQRVWPEFRLSSWRSTMIDQILQQEVPALVEDALLGKPAVSMPHLTPRLWQSLVSAIDRLP